VAERFFQIIELIGTRKRLLSPAKSANDLLAPLSFARRMPDDLIVDLEAARQGDPADFDMIGSWIPVVTEAVADVIADAAGPHVQLLPVRLDGVPAPVRVVNVLARYDCEDEDATAAMRRSTASLVDYAMRFVIDPHLVGESPIFRIRRGPLVMTERLADELQRREAFGVKFVELPVA
jgi:hypothetical protein